MGWQKIGNIKGEPGEPGSGSGGSGGPTFFPANTSFSDAAYVVWEFGSTEPDPPNPPFHFVHERTPPLFEAGEGDTVVVLATGMYRIVSPSFFVTRAVAVAEDSVVQFNLTALPPPDLNPFGNIEQIMYGFVENVVDVGEFSAELLPSYGVGYGEIVMLGANTVLSLDVEGINVDLEHWQFGITLAPMIVEG